MPRMTNQDYFEYRNYLHDLWLAGRSIFVYISIPEQRALHDFFRFTEEDITQQELIAFRKALAKERSSLPQRAGRALNSLCDVHDYIIAYKRSPPQCSGTGVRVRGLVRPQPDYKMLVAAVYKMAEEHAQTQLPTTKI